MAQAVYVVLVKEQGLDDSYVLPDGAMGLDRAQQLMQFRAEELLEEMDEQELEADGEAGLFTIHIADDRMSISITNDSEADVKGEGGREVASMNIQAVSLVDINEE